jgi:hypothetical protein
VRYIAVLLLTLIFSLSGVYADKVYTERFKDIEYFDFDFKVTISESGVAHGTWNSYPKGKWFTYYKFLYSTKYANPVYPDLSAKYVGTDISDLETSFHLDSWDTHYFRLCAITDEGYGVKGRYCSTTRKEEVDREKEVEVKKEEYSDTEYKISEELKEKIEVRLELFIEKLESDYNDDEIVAIIDNVLLKLDRYKDDARYSVMLGYMQKLLKEYKTEYINQLDIFDDIFWEY